MHAHPIFTLDQCRQAARGGRATAVTIKTLVRYHFDESNATLLEQGLLGIARSEAVVESMRSRHGMKYIVDGAIATPLGSRVKLRTIWIIEQGQERPRFVTAYPL